MQLCKWMSVTPQSTGIGICSRLQWKICIHEIVKAWKKYAKHSKSNEKSSSRWSNPRYCRGKSSPTKPQKFAIYQYIARQVAARGRVEPPEPTKTKAEIERREWAERYLRERQERENKPPHN